MSEPPPRDLCCARCGYALEGLPPASACPECNLPITDSIDAANSAMQIPIQKITHGTRLAINGTTALLFITLLQVILFQTLLVNPTFLFFFQWLPCLAILLSAAGWFKIASKGAPGPADTRLKRTRPLLRIGLIVFMLLTVYQTIAPFLGMFNTSLWLMFALVVVPYALFYPCTILYTAFLHESLPHSKIARRNKWMVALTVLMTLLYFLPYLRFFLRGSNPNLATTPAWADLLVEYIFYIALFSLYILQLIVAIALRRHTKRLRALTSDAATFKASRKEITHTLHPYREHNPSNL